MSVMCGVMWGIGTECWVETVNLGGSEDLNARMGLGVYVTLARCTVWCMHKICITQ